MKMERKGNSIYIYKSSIPYYVGMLFFSIFIYLGLYFIQSTEYTSLTCHYSKIPTICTLNHASKTTSEENSYQDQPSITYDASCNLKKYSVSINPFHFVNHSLESINPFYLTQNDTIENIEQLGIWLNYGDRFYEMISKDHFPGLFEIFPPVLADAIGFKKFSFVLVTKSNIHPISSGYSSWHLHKFNKYKETFEVEYNTSRTEGLPLEERTIEISDHSLLSCFLWCFLFLVIGITSPINLLSDIWEYDMIDQKLLHKQYSMFGNIVHPYRLNFSSTTTTHKEDFNYIKASVVTRVKNKGYDDMKTCHHVFLQGIDSINFHDEEKNQPTSRVRFAVFNDKKQANDMASRINSFLSGLSLPEVSKSKSD